MRRKYTKKDQPKKQHKYEISKDSILEILFYMCHQVDRQKVIQADHQ